MSRCTWPISLGLLLLSQETRKLIAALLLILPLAFLTGAAGILFFAIRRSRADQGFTEQVRLFKSSGNYIWCWLLLQIWIIRFKAKRLVPYFVILTVSVAGAFTVIEILVRLQKSLVGLTFAWFACVLTSVILIYYLSHRSRASSLYSYLVIAVSSGAIFLTFAATIFGFLRKGFGLLGRLAQGYGDFIDYLGGNPLILFGLLVIEILVLLHHWEEHGKRGRESSVFTALGFLLADLTTQNAIFVKMDSDEQIRAMRNFHKNFFVIFATLLREREIEELDISIMFFDQADHTLRIFSLMPDDPARVDLNFHPRIGVGGSGKAYESGNLIYLPSVQYGHAIEYEVFDQTSKRRLNDYKMKLIPQVYVQSAKEPFKSIVSVPIRDAVASKFGVVNFSSPRSNAFSVSEFNLLLLSGRILGLLYR